jgi:hypothetical protein
VDAYTALAFFFVVLVHQQDDATELNYLIMIPES